jgi:16S rRNA A1518/A1519 N6-dimethyltransferase RsmA/KsgA/DIM1 with predicted DNA glycosylase/AP lyase activity
MSKKVVKYFSEYIASKPQFRLPFNRANSYIFDDTLCHDVIEALGGVKDRIILQLCSGAGSMSRSFLNSGSKHIIAIESNRRYEEALKDLADEASENLFSYRIHEIYYWSYVIEKWPELFKNVRKQSWEVLHDELILFGILPTRNAHYYLPNLFRQVASQSFLFQWGRIPIYLVIPERVATFLTINPGDKRRNVISLQAQAYCEIELLLRIPQEHVTSGLRESCVLVKITPLKHSKCSGIPYEEYEFVIRQLYVQKTHNLISAIG